MIFNIPDIGWARIQDSTLDIVYAGSFTTGLEVKELNSIKLGFLKNNCVGKFIIRLHTSTNFNRVYAQSAVVDFSDVVEQSFFGNIRFDFNKINLAKTTKYWVTIEAIEYTRVSDTQFVGWIHDLPSPTNVSTGNWPTDHPIRMQLFAKGLY